MKNGIDEAQLKNMLTGGKLKNNNRNTEGDINLTQSDNK